MSKLQILIVFTAVLVAILAAAYIVYTQSPKSLTGYRPGYWPEADTAVNQASFIYQLKKESGQDFSNGPCLTNALMPNWSLDLAHSPRKPIDDLPENQCSAYIEGSSQHFVELDLEGNLIRVK